MSVLEEVLKLAPTLHTAGTFSPLALQALYRHASARRIRHSVETGAGASTLLFSQLSGHHTVFALDAGTGSIRSIERSPLLRAEAVTFVEGPTQLTLPTHTFDAPLQLALIDGPHAYPFPDLEYYFIYPHLEPDALLIVDDIHIPTIANLFDFLAADDMFALEEVVETTAFFRRTGAPTFSPTGDGWNTQGYNRRAFAATDASLVTGALPARSETPAAAFVDRVGPVAQPAAGTVIRVAAGEPLEIVGWAVDQERREPAAGIDLEISGRTYRAGVGGMRPDVASALQDERYARSGFHTRLLPDALTKGSHDLAIRVVLHGGRESRPALRLRLEVVESTA